MMRRSPMPPRQHPLRSRTGMARRSRLPRIPYQPNPAEQNAKTIVRARSRGLCELCGRPAESWAHRRARSQLGLWVPANGLHLCGLDNTSGCHGWTEQHPLAADTGGWRLVHRDPDPEAAPVFLPRRGGWVLLDNAGDVHPWPGYGPPPAVLPPTITGRAA